MNTHDHSDGCYRGEWCQRCSPRNLPPNRSACERSTRPQKLRSAVPTESNKRYRAVLVGVAVTVATLVFVYIGSMIVEANTTYEGECAIVAKIDKTHDVVVCVRGIKKQYPDAPPAPTHRGPRA